MSVEPEVNVFFDDKGQPQFVQLPYKDYDMMIHQIKETAEIHKVLDQMRDLLGSLQG